MEEADPYTSAYRTAEPMAPQQADPRSAEIPAGWRSISGSERRKKVDSVASLNEMAERDLAEFMSETSLANNLFGYSPQTENFRNSVNEDEYVPGPSDMWNRNFSEIRERSLPAPANPMYTNVSNIPLFLPQGPPLSAVLHQSHSGYGPPTGPLTSPPNFIPVTPVVSRPSSLGMPVMPSSIPVHHIPSHMVAISNPLLRSVHSPPNPQTPPYPASKSPTMAEESPRLRERAPPPARERVRERAHAVKSEDTASAPLRQSVKPESIPAPSVSPDSTPTASNVPAVPPTKADASRPDENGKPAVSTRLARPYLRPSCVCA